jgi:hypothetical protein
VLLKVEGLSPGQEVVWHRVSGKGDTVLAVGNDCLFYADSPGRREFTVRVASEQPGPFEAAGYTLVYGKDEPQPNPTPVPPVPGKRTLLIIGETELDKRSEVVAALVVKLRSDPWMEAQGHKLVALDPGQEVTDTRGRLTPHPLITSHYVKDESLPVAVVFADGKAIHRGPVPTTYEGIQKLLGETDGRD